MRDGVRVTKAAPNTFRDHGLELKKSSAILSFVESQDWPLLSSLHGNHLFFTLQRRAWILIISFPDL